MKVLGHSSPPTEAVLFTLGADQRFFNFLEKLVFPLSMTVVPSSMHFVIRLAFFFFFSHTAVGIKIPPLIEMESSTIEQAFFNESSGRLLIG